MRYARIKLLGITQVFPDAKVGDVVETEWPTARHLVRTKVAEMICDDLAAGRDLLEKSPAFSATVEPPQAAVIPEPKGRRPGK